MNIHNLHIIAKNRDAVAAQKGYSYQQLKTLEDWIENRIINGDADIYCEYEDDIFANDPVNGISTFKQIKLYSSNFSFASESVIKALENFFSLYVKGEYSFDKVQFLFETNVSVAGRNIKDNDAELLDNWHKQQDNLTEELITKIRVRVKKILDDYVNSQLSNLATNTNSKSEAQKAKIIYDNLTDQDFDSFIKCIKWDFSNEDTNVAVEKIINNIKDLIKKIPLPLNSGMVEIYFSLLVNEVFQKSIQDSPQDRKLTKDLLDSVLLNAGEEDDKWYIETYEQFKQFSPLEFYFGEYQAAISAARYCRWKSMDDGHKNFWLKILWQIINISTIPIINKRHIIYEYLFLKIGHDFEQDRSKSPIAEDIALVNTYIDSWSPEICDSRTLETDIIFFQLIKAQINGFKLRFSSEKLIQWGAEIKKFLQYQEVNETNVDKLCEIYELQGQLEQVINDNIIDGFKRGFVLYRKILPLLKETHFYSLAKLYEELQERVKYMISYGSNDEILELTDEFMAEIEEHATRTGLRHKAAHDFIERAQLHLNRNDLSNILKALDLLHKAKDRWRLEYTRKGYVLALFGIAGIYEKLGLSYASKYYSLIAFWSIWHSNDSNLKKYIPRAFFQITHLDFIHGSWVNSLSEFELYLISKREFDEKGFEIEKDDYFRNSLVEISIIYASTKLLYPEINSIIEDLKQNFGDFWTIHIEPISESIASEIGQSNSLNNLLKSTLLDLPFNDIGSLRKIKFKALGNDWIFQFANSTILTGIAEEFISFFQVLICEHIYGDYPFYISGTEVNIEIEQGHFQKEALGKNQWRIFIPEFDSKEQKEVNRHYLYLGVLANAILQDISNLSKVEYSKFHIEELLEKRKFAEKAMEAAAYQRVYKHTIMRESKIFKQSKESATLNYPEDFLTYNNLPFIKEN
ncbi:hypothetical protein [Sphingobacterium siyangense]|uniref:hypothetical protein n=1 Tax=Sphingobacterium siyangense TaxID=459529 RepID=UPI002FDE3001